MINHKEMKNMNSIYNAIGGYTPFTTDISDECLTVFAATMKEIVGVGYHPFAVSTQVVKGINYRFLCTATNMDKEMTTYSVMLGIYKPLSGSAIIKSINEI